MSPYSERRQTIRIAVHGNLNVESATAGQTLRLVDVGMGGFCVRSLVELPLDVVASYRFLTPDRTWSAIFRARVVHSQLSPPADKSVQPYKSGMMFVNTESAFAQQELIALKDHAMSFVSFS